MKRILSAVARNFPVAIRRLAQADGNSLASGQLDDDRGNIRWRFVDDAASGPDSQGETLSPEQLHDLLSGQRFSALPASSAPLTDLNDRSRFVQTISSLLAARRDPTLGLIVYVFDLSGLSTINDGLSHGAGDRVLRLVARRMRRLFGDDCALGHLGGGTYAVCMPIGLEDREAASHLRQKIDGVLLHSIVVDEQELYLASRAGYAVFPADARESDSLLQCAETALDHTKRSGERYLRYCSSMNLVASEELNITSRLRRLVLDEELRLEYQPKVRLCDGAVDGAEALLRWPDGSVSPHVFVPILESIGLIDRVGRWVLGKALTETARWPSHAQSGGFRVAVNVSPWQLRRPQFVDDVLQVIDSAKDLCAKNLELEVTETMLMSDPQRACAILTELRSQGITIAIDDFGTGHSSLQLLSLLPIDVLKIDRSFTQMLGTSRRHRLVVQTTIALARALGMKTVAEGVEDEAQVEILGELGCDLMQGYLIRRPAPASDIAAWLMREFEGRDVG